MRSRASSLLVVVLFVLPGAAAHAGAASFQGLGFLPGGTAFSGATAVSADGTTVVGEGRVEALATFDQIQAFRWTAASGMEPLPCDGLLFAGAACKLRPAGVSADGGVVVGTALVSLVTELWERPFRLEPPGDAVPLPTPRSDGSATDVSDDGAVVVGTSFTETGDLSAGFRWTEATGSVDLDEEGMSAASAVSGGGAVVAGSLVDVLGSTEAARWTESQGLVGLGAFPEPQLTRSSANGVSDDGDLVVGQASSNFDGALAFRWTEATGMQSLGDLDGGGLPDSTASAVSADGFVVVGRAASASGDEAVVWRGGQPLERLADALVAHGVHLAGWTLRAATGVSGDGRTIVGNGTNPDGDPEAWIAVLPVPEAPGMAGTAVACATLALVLARARSKASTLDGDSAAR